MNHARIAHRIREKVAEFSRKVSQGLPKTAGRLVTEVVYGIQSRGSVRLSEIARSLEEKTAMKKIIERLSRQLNRPGLGEQVTGNLLDLAAKRMGEETLLVVDPTDISKRYARKMEYLARVRDGSGGGDRGAVSVALPGDGGQRNPRGRGSLSLRFRRLRGTFSRF